MIDWSQRADVLAPQLLGSVLTDGHVAIQFTELEAYLGTTDPASHAFRGKTQRNAAMFGPPAHLYVYVSYGIHRAGNLVCSPDGVAGGILMRAGRVVYGEDEARRRRRASATATHVWENLARGPGNLGQALGLSEKFSGIALHVHNPCSVNDACEWLRAKESITVENGHESTSEHVGNKNTRLQTNPPNENAPEQLRTHKLTQRAYEQLRADSNQGREEPRFDFFPCLTQEPRIACGPRIGISKNVEAPLRFWIPDDKTVTRPRAMPR